MRRCMRWVRPLAAALLMTTGAAGVAMAHDDGDDYQPRYQHGWHYGAHYGEHAGCHWDRYYGFHCGPHYGPHRGAHHNWYEDNDE